MMFYKNTKGKVRSPDEDIDLFDIVAGVLHGDIFGPYLFIICLDYVFRTSTDIMKENSFTLKGKKQTIPCKTITDADYADDIALLANTPTQAASLLHSLEKAAGGIGYHMNAVKTKYVYFNQTFPLRMVVL